jgi:hypothetical protein
MEVCNRSAHCEGINGRQPHNPSTLVLLVAPTRSAHGRAGATGSVRHKRVRCNSDSISCVLLVIKRFNKIDIAIITCRAAAVKIDSKESNYQKRFSDNTAINGNYLLLDRYSDSLYLQQNRQLIVAKSIV